MKYPRRTHGRLVSTYESAAIRRFKKGRVDNIRAAHLQALEFVQTMHDPKADLAEKRAKFDAAIQKQTTIMMENITGYGIDNHLVALRDICRENAEKEQRPPPKLFDNYLYKEVMRFPLSTSQVTTTLPNTFLCYGPVVDDGYGGAYNLRNDEILFAISAFNECQWTSAQKFRMALIDCLNETKMLLEQTK